MRNGSGKHIVWSNERVYVRRRRMSAVIGVVLSATVGVGVGVGVAGLRYDVRTVAQGSDGQSSVAQSQKQVKSNTANDAAAISTTGFTLDTDSQLAIESQISNFESDGYTIAFVLSDVTTGRAMAYNADSQIYSASAIKAPYLMALASSGAIDVNAVYQAGNEQTATLKRDIDQVLTVSDNDAYARIYEQYGHDSFNAWAQQSGAATRMGGSRGYVYTSARDMAKLWSAGYGVLLDHQTSGAAAISDEALQWLSGDMTNSLNSSIHSALGDTNTVYTKAGWINGEGDFYALNDGGIVTSSVGNYVLTVMSTACGRSDLMTDLVSTLDSVHAGVMQG
jgi:beta-lactamase class A